MFRRYVEDNDRDKHLNGDLIDNACPAFAPWIEVGLV